MEDGSVRTSGATLELAWTTQGDLARVGVQGELDTETAGELEHVVQELMGDGVRRVVVDLAGLDFLDSSGLRVLIRAQRQLAEHDGVLELHGVPAFAVRLLRVTGLDAFFVVR